MHEVSLALNILEIAEKQCKESGCTKIESITLDVGRGAGVMKDALLFAFDAVKQGTLAEKAELIINDVLFSGHCRSCNQDFTSEQEYVLFCPLCSSFEIEIHRGREMNIIEMEVDE